MRTIKFREWNIEENSMSVPYNLDGEIYFSDDIILMQFTGLKDKNDKEIYEGDIITESVQNELGSFTKEKPLEVYFNSTTGSFRGQDSKDQIHDWSIGKNCEVIGNIYENPELLKSHA